MQDHAIADKADPRDDTLDYSGHFGLRVLGDREHGQGRSERDKGKRTQSCRLVM